MFEKLSLTKKEKIINLQLRNNERDRFTVQRMLINYITFFQFIINPIG